MFKARYKKYTLEAKRSLGTSRGSIDTRDIYYIILQNDSGQEIGIGECSTLKGLSIDHIDGYEEKVKEVCKNINEYVQNPHIELFEWPSICFGLETALKDLQNGGKRILFPSAFTESKEGVYINGLIWMGDFEYMQDQLDAKIKEGFKCIKIKIGAIDFIEELQLLSLIREKYSDKEIELRLDANGAFERFDDEEVLQKLEQLSQYNIHSIEQPIMAGSWERMAEICKHSPIPIALDEELIGRFTLETKRKLVDTIQPQYLILKPSLLGGFAATKEWINIAEENEISWWMTSALESNIGLNAIAQWAYTFNNPLPQGLGTGQLYSNNIPSPLVVEQSRLSYKSGTWDISAILK